MTASAVTRSEFRIRDPFVLVDDGRYYLYESKPWFGGTDVKVRTSTDLENWSDPLVALQMPTNVPCTAMWAPEVHKFGGKYYLFVTVSEKKGARPIAVMGPRAKETNLSPRGTWGFVADAPKGPFKPIKEGPLPPEGMMTLDGTLHIENGKPYFVYCHEWCQMGNGTMEYAPLKSDFTGFAAEPIHMFDAESALPGAGIVTDGCFLWRSPNSGVLHMIWSNVVKGHGYCILVRRSESGSIAGPWTKDEILYGENGGHGMIFVDLNGCLRLTFHQPNINGKERMAIFELKEENGRLKMGHL